MKKSFGSIVAAIVSFFAATNCFAQTPLTTMPLDINIGVTRNTSVEDKGVCISTVKTKDSVSHCIRYSMQNNTYGLYCNRDGVILKVSFLAVSHHILPKTWSDLGLKLALAFRYKKIVTPVAGAPVAAVPAKPFVDESGSSQQQVIDIFTANGAKNISHKTSYTSELQVGEHVTFTIGKLQYTAEFIKWLKPKWCSGCNDYDNGLVSIEIVEAVE